MTDTIDDVDEHPIIFNEWSINRILAGEKTQTRRIVKPQPPDSFTPHPEYGAVGPFYHDGMQEPYGYGFCDQNGKEYECPYGQPGDVLWVREGFQFPEFEDDVSPRDLVDYWVGEVGAPPPVKYSTGETKRAWNGHDWGRKRPYIHMPKELCRLRLRVEDVRVERVQEIDGYDASAEGIQPPRPEVENGTRSIHDVKRRMFREKWNDIHDDGAWERNDWVWIITFSRIDNA